MLFRSPRLPVVVREHRPEPAEGVGAEVDPELRDVAFEVRADELLAPSLARGVAGRQERAWEAPAQPQGSPTLRSDLGDAQAVERVERDATRERLRALAQQIRRRAAEHDEARAQRATIGEDAPLDDVAGAAPPIVAEPPPAVLIVVIPPDALKLCTPVEVIDAFEPAPVPPVTVMPPLVVHSVCVPCEVICATELMPDPPVTSTLPFTRMF